MTNEQTTDATGKATFELEYGDYVATITKDGYQTKTENIAFRSNHKNFSITLEEDTPTGTGTVTVTCQTDPDNPISNAVVYLCDTNELPSQQDDSHIVAIGRTDSNGETTLALWDKTAHQPTQDDDIPFGNYYIFVTSAYDPYSGTLTVDGDENVTITLIEREVVQDPTFTVVDTNNAPISGAEIYINTSSVEIDIYTQSDGTIQFNGEVPIGTYPLYVTVNNVDMESTITFESGVTEYTITYNPQQ